MSDANTNRILPETEGNLLCVEIGERVTLKDYQEIFEPAMKTLFGAHDSARAVISYTRPFLGWDLDAAEYDIAMMTKLGRKVTKVALVHPPETVINRWQLLKPLLSGEVRIFQEGELNDALTWAKA